jgi:Pyruvate/2-oxoacid:ferredoxin oxidoreductase gamma subunit
MAIRAEGSRARAIRIAVRLGVITSTVMAAAVMTAFAVMPSKQSLKESHGLRLSNST